MKRLKTFFLVSSLFCMSFGNVAKAKDKPKDDFHLGSHIVQLVGVAFLFSAGGWGAYELHRQGQVLDSNNQILNRLDPGVPTDCEALVLGQSYYSSVEPGCVRELLRGNDGRMWVRQDNPINGTICGEGTTEQGPLVEVSITGGDNLEACYVEIDNSQVDGTESVSGTIVSDGSYFIFDQGETWIHTSAY